MDGRTKLRIHMTNTVLNTGISEMFKKENNHTAVPPRTTTSKIKKVGTIDTRRYIAKITGTASENDIDAPKNDNKLKNK